jgi:L-asparaginase
MIVPRRVIGVLGTGGTIAMTGADQLDTVEYADTVEVMDVERVVAGVPVVDRVADVVPIAFRALKSNAETLETWIELAITAERALDDGVEGTALDGLVVTHGTTTLEEVAYFLHLTVATSKPLVIVGAQRPPSALSSDAPINLVRAVQVAASDHASGLGVLVLFNDEIHSARDVTKTSNHRLNAFTSPSLGPLGYAEADLGVSLYRRPMRRHTVASALCGAHRAVTAPLPRVDVIASYAGADGALVHAAIDAGARGLVVATMPPGLLPPAQDEAVGAAVAAGVTVVLASRAGTARLLRRRHHDRFGLIVADDLSPQAARVALALALAAGVPKHGLQGLFDEH